MAAKFIDSGTVEQELSHWVLGMVAVSRQTDTL